MDLNPIDDLTGALGGVIGGATKAAGDAVLDSALRMIFRLIANAVTSLTSALATAINTSTVVDLQRGWFASDRQQRLIALVVAISTVLILAFVLMTVLRSLLAGEPAQMARAVLVDVPIAIFASVALTTITTVLLGATDAACGAVMGDVTSSLGQFAALLGTADALSATGLLGMVFGLLFIAAAVVVWIQLLLRSALLYLVVTFAPLGFAARVYPGGRQVARRTIEIGLALIVSKFAVCLAFATGGAALTDGAPAGTPVTPDLRSMLVGAAIMMLAAFMPWLVWRIIPVFESATVMQGVERAPIRTATSVVSAAVTAASAARLAGGAGASAEAGEAAPSGPPLGGSTTILDRAAFAHLTSTADVLDDRDPAS